MNLDIAVEKPLHLRLRRPLGRLRRFASRALRLNALFVWLVLAPTGLSILYFGLIAHDVYVSESQFVVRTVQRQTLSGLGSLLQGTGLTQGSEDVYSVQNYLLSRDALQSLEQRYHLKRSFTDTGIDVIARFNALRWDDSFENLLKYYQRFIVDPELDSTSSILTLTVRAFSAEEAHAINQNLLALSENFVNKLNERALKDLVRFAMADVDGAEKQERTAVTALSSYRNQHSLYDPQRQSDLKLQEIGTLQTELVATRKQIADLKAFARDNPQIPVLQNREKVSQTQISEEMAKVAGGQSSLSSSTPDYEAIMLDREFADKYLGIALDSLEQARQNAMSQQLYIERIEEPNKPDIAIEPRRIRDVAATLLLSLIVWGIASLLVTAIKEHSN